jgi:outer membrane protein assembly factor BamB
MHKHLLALIITASFALTARAADVLQWGGGPNRNMVNVVEKGLPTEWDIKSGKNIKWSVKLGSQAYGNPVIADGRVFVGTNNEGLYDPEIKGDKGNIVCFAEKDGAFLWQAVHDKLSAGRVNDWPYQGICSTICIEGNRGWYFNNRCEVVCVTTEGMAGGKNEGVQDETYKGEKKADVVWRYDMIEELGVFPHNLATSSPVIHEDLVFLVTGNGVDEGHLNLPSQVSPSFAAFNKKTGELAWEFAVEDRILHGQWSSGSVGIVNGKAQAVFPGGDGWVYALDATTGELIWKFNSNPAGSKWELGGYGTKNNLIATPVVLDNKVYIGVGQDPEHGTGIGHLYAIDATGKGDVTKSHVVWHLGGDDFGRTMSTVAIHEGLLYVSELSGILFCIEAATGKVIWKHDQQASVWGSSMVVDGHVYVGDEDGDITVLEHGRELKVVNTMNMGESVYTTPTAANGVLYVTTKSHLYAIAGK